MLYEVITKSDELLIPKSAVLWTGKRSVVYVKVPGTENPTFSFREIELGPETGNYYVVANGLNEGEEVAVNGVFKIDAAAQLQGLPSMMNPNGGDSGAGKMPGMDMGGSSMASPNTKEAETEVDNSKISSEFKKQLQRVYDAYLNMKNAFIESVITSYSIHYTKLYDFRGHQDHVALERAVFITDSHTPDLIAAVRSADNI